MNARRPAPRALGILGGTFNPPHLGHLAVARHALDELALERVLLVPTHTAPHKAGDEGGSDGQGGRDPGPQHRLRMCQLAVAGVDGLAVCDVEVERGGLSYTVDTLRSMHASHPDADLTLIVGADTAGTLGSWREAAQLLQMASLAVAARAGAARQPVPVDARVRFLEMPTIAVSSSLARQRVARGEPVEELVGPAVARYIDEHHLYRAGAEALA